jgi:putative hydrolase of the HAD superfamily
MRTIMLDVDGVLVRGRPADGLHFSTDLEKDLGLPFAALQQAFFKSHWAEIVTGRRPLRPTLDDVLASLGASATADAVIRYWFENDSRIDGHVLDAVAAYRRQGGCVFLATNQEHMRASYLMNDLGLSGHVEGIIYSAAIGHRKPWPEFFALAAARSSSTGSDILLVDDTLENVEAARAFGWKAVHWQDGMDAAAVLNGVA